MGTLYYAINTERKEIVILGKYTEIIDHDADYKRCLNLSDEVMNLAPNSTYWRTFVEALRTFNADLVISDADETDLYDEYRVALSRYAEDANDVGKTLSEYYGY
jgi:hypothetical protein